MKVLNRFKNFLAIDEEYSNLENSQIAILPVPYEHTVSYGRGTRKGPNAILKASSYVEFYDNEFDRELCFDLGIATLEPIKFKEEVNQDAINLIYKKVKKLLKAEKFVVTLGGEHTISFAPIIAHSEKYPQMSLLQFDAHSDLRDNYENNLWSHACVIRRVCDSFDPSKITQVGIRALCKEESEYIKENRINTFFANQIKRSKSKINWKKRIVDTLSEEVYITFDVDYFDPAIMPSTGTPEPEGFFYSETIEIIQEIKDSGKKIIGFDVVELAPNKRHLASDLLTARLIYKILNIIFS